MFRLHISVGCLAVFACLLITSSAFAQIDLPEASQPSVQQFQSKLPDGAVPPPVMESHLTRPATTPAPAQSASIDRASSQAGVDT